MKDDNLNMKEREVGGLRFGYGLNVRARNNGSYDLSNLSKNLKSGKSGSGC